MARTAVRDRLTVTVEDAKHFLRVDGSEDDQLIMELVDSAKASADAFLNNPFTDSTGADLPIPDDVRLWVLRRVAFAYENRVESLVIDNVAGVGSAEYGGRLQQATTLDYSLIRPYRLNPGL